SSCAGLLVERGLSPLTQRARTAAVATASLPIFSARFGWLHRAGSLPAERAGRAEPRFPALLLPVGSGRPGSDCRRCFSLLILARRDCSADHARRRPVRYRRRAFAAPVAARLGF